MSREVDLLFPVSNPWAKTLPFPHWLLIRHGLLTLVQLRDNRGLEFGVTGVTAPWSRTEKPCRAGFPNWVHVTALDFPGV